MTATVACSLYGKLPAARDYVWRNCKRPAAAWFRGWLDEAAPFLPSMGGLDSIRACVSAPSGERIVAVVRPSSDAGGFRAFPFSAFVEIAGQEFPGAAELKALFRECNGAIHRLLPAKNEQELARLMSTIDDPGSRVETASFPPCPTLKEWIVDLFGGDREAFPLALWRLHQAAAGGTLRPGATERIRIPLSSRCDPAEQAASWAELIQNLCGGKRFDLVAASQTARAGQILIAFRSLLPGDLAGLEPSRVSGTLDLEERTIPKSLDGYSTFAAEVEECLFAEGARSLWEVASKRSH